MAKKRALIVAIDDYEDDRNDLNSCIADAMEAKRILRQTYGFPSVDIRTLLDKQATLSAVRESFSWLLPLNIEPHDRIVFFYSGHGFQQVEGNTLTESLVLYDGFLLDDELSKITRKAPLGTLTIVLDSCFSGGMQKIGFSPGGAIETRRNKVWVSNEEQAREKNKALGGVTTFRPFLSRPITVSAGDAVEKRFSPSALENVPKGKGLDGEDEQGQPESNGLLITACRQNETASAKTESTDGLSAFTFSLREAIKELGPQASADVVVSRAERTLTELNFEQRPMLLAPSARPDLASLPLITLDDSSSSSSSDGAAPGQPHDITAVVIEALVRGLLRSH